ncbi:MAG: hypothetical protein L7F78_00400 [Syntrophales bacterium LBB04]|nr:hypothetical protein [Syntrophales bacterium LBB04]
MKILSSAFRQFFKQSLLLVLCLLLTGCGASKPIPDWLSISYSQLESYKKSYLSGKEQIAAIQFKGALSEIKKSGDLEILARAHLTRMALQTALLEDMESDEFLKIDALSPSVQNRNFYAFLKGEMAQVEEKLLPPQYQGISKNVKQPAGAAQLQELGKIEDPLSQLIAIGILVRLHQENEAILQRAIDTASAQGWKKALLVYLERLKLSYEVKKKPEKALAIEQRIKLIRD